MKHRKSGRKLNRSKDHYVSMFCNMTRSLIDYEIIKTTLQKAKELRRFIEPLITLSKINNISNRRIVFSRLHSTKITSKLFNELGPRFITRTGGYTRVLKCGFRTGDNASMAYIELLDRVEKT